MKAYVEYGIDFDNNRFGIGKSIEIENADGTEYRTKTNINLYNKKYYFRLWLGKKVFSYSVNDGFKIKNPATRRMIKITTKTIIILLLSINISP